MKRRNFLKSSAILSAPLLLKGIPVIASPKLENQSLEILANAAAECGKILVIIQMNGGNDGLNTIFPLDQWSKLFNARANILMKESDVLNLKKNDKVGFHPAMTDLRNLYDEGKMIIVQGVSYPNPNFSHFRATDIMFTASDSDEDLQTGWLGRTFDKLHPNFPEGYPNTSTPDPLAIQIGANLPFSLQGEKFNMGYNVSDPAALLDVINSTIDPAPNNDYGTELTFIRTMKEQSNDYKAVIQKAYNTVQSSPATYPNSNGLANQLKIVAKLINGGLKTSIYIVNHPNTHDTHFDQVDKTDKKIGSQAANLTILSQAVGAFMKDLKAMGKENLVTTMTHSEFGRRIKSNASFGTDHGSAAPVMIFGSALNTNPARRSKYPIPGMIGTTPVLPENATVTDQVPMQFDFRQIYASILEDWLCMSAADTTSILGRSFEKLPIFKSESQLSNEEFETIDLSNTKNFIDVYPNPITGNEVTISFKNSINSNVNVAILDLQGVALLRNNYAVLGSELKINMDNKLPSSIYILEVNHEGKKFYEKITVK